MKKNIFINQAMYSYEEADSRKQLFKRISARCKFFFRMQLYIIGYLMFTPAERLEDAAQQTFTDFHTFIEK